MTEITLAGVKFFVSQNVIVHNDIALNEGSVISLALFGIYKVSEKYFKYKNYDGRKIIGPCVIH